jgi:hypothetical protein
MTEGRGRVLTRSSGECTNGLQPLPRRAVVAVLLTVALAASCAVRREKMLVGEIAQAIQTSPSRIDLARLYPAAWDRVCVIPSHTSAAAARSVLGFDDRRAGRLAERDDVSGLWFVRGRKVISAVNFPRRQGDFGAAGAAYCLPRDSAIFQAELTPAGAARVLPLSTSITNRPPPPAPAQPTP